MTLTTCNNHYNEQIIFLLGPWTLGIEVQIWYESCHREIFLILVLHKRGKVCVCVGEGGGKRLYQVNENIILNTVCFFLLFCFMIDIF